MEAGGLGKNFKNPRNENAKKFKIVIHYCALFDWFLNCSLKWPPWRLGGWKAVLKPQD